MPKDNEVDEKVKPVAWIVSNGGESCEPWLEYEQSEVDALPAVCIAEPLYSAATVAELRAEVEWVRGINSSLVDKCNRLNLCWAQSDQRAAAAERRVGELEALLTNIKELPSMWRGFAVPSDSSCMNAHDCADDLDAALTKESP